VSLAIERPSTEATPCFLLHFRFAQGPVMSGKIVAILIRASFRIERAQISSHNESVQYRRVSSFYRDLSASFVLIHLSNYISCLASLQFAFLSVSADNLCHLLFLKWRLLGVVLILQLLSTHDRIGWLQSLIHVWRCYDQILVLGTCVPHPSHLRFAQMVETFQFRASMNYLPVHSAFLKVFLFSPHRFTSITFYSVVFILFIVPDRSVTVCFLLFHPFTYHSDLTDTPSSFH
jgi:hypothetical protein